MVNYKVQHVTNKAKLQTKAFNPATLTIHSTGNPSSTAQNERDYLNSASNTSEVSFHVAVDQIQAVECLPLTMRAWHAGTQEGNNTSIGLEICESGDREKTLKNAAWTAAKILKEKGWGIDKLRQHYDWSKKDCPRILRSTGRWNEFVNMVKSEMEETNMSKFIDVPEDHWAKDRIEQMADLGLIKGFEDGSYKPNQSMSRAEMAVVFGRFYDLMKKEYG